MNKQTDVLSAIAAAFPEDDPAEILSILEEIVDPFSQSREKGQASLRVVKAVLHLSKGDKDKLRQYVQAANVDFRDVLFWAESPPTPAESMETLMRLGNWLIAQGKLEQGRALLAKANELKEANNS